MAKSNFNFNELFHVIFKHIWIVILLTVIGAAATFVLRPKVSITHSATAQFMVSPKRQYDVTNNTLSDLVKTRDVLGVAVKQYNHEIDSSEDKASYADLAARDSSLVVSVTGNSRIITISVGEESAKDVKRLANLIVERAVKVADTNLPTWKSQVITKAYITSKEEGAFSGKKALVLGAAVGFVVGIEAAILYDRFLIGRLKRNTAK